MDALAKRLLEAFDRLGRPALEFADLARAAAPSDSAAVRTAVEALLGQGLLRATNAAEVYSLTEDGRLALATPRDLTLYTRRGCHLCEQAKQQIVPLVSRYGARLREVNIDADPLLCERYTNDVPVIFLGARKVAKHRINLEQFRRQLEQAQRQK